MTVKHWEYTCAPLCMLLRMSTCKTQVQSHSRHSYQLSTLQVMSRTHAEPHSVHTSHEQAQSKCSQCALAVYYCYHVIFANNWHPGYPAQCAARRDLHHSMVFVSGCRAQLNGLHTLHECHKRKGKHSFHVRQAYHAGAERAGPSITKRPDTTRRCKTGSQKFREATGTVMAATIAWRRRRCW